MVKGTEDETSQNDISKYTICMQYQLGCEDMSVDVHIAEVRSDQVVYVDDGLRCGTVQQKMRIVWKCYSLITIS